LPPAALAAAAVSRSTPGQRNTSTRFTAAAGSRSVRATMCTAASTRSSATGIHLQRAARALGPPVAEGAIDLCAAQVARETCAQLSFGRAQLIRQAKARFQEAMIHAA